MSLTEIITNYAQDFIRYAGPAGATLLMALESMIAPIPSEAVMPFVGILVKKGEWSLATAITMTSLGSLIGSLISYWLGAVGGKPLVMKVGRYLFINEHHLDVTIQWFHKRGGSWTVFISRFVPVVRHLISVPAGMGKMPLLKFSIVSVIGATMWNCFLLYLGYQWQDHIEDLKHYYKILDVAVIAVGVIGVGLWFYLHMKKPVKPSPSTGGSSDPEVQVSVEVRDVVESKD